MAETQTEPKVIPVTPLDDPFTKAVLGNQIADLIKKDPKLKEEHEKEINAELEKIEQHLKDNPGIKPGDKIETTVDEPVDKKDNKPVVSAETDKKPDIELDSDNPFLTGLKKPAETKVEFKEFKDASEYIKKETGLEVKEMADLVVVVNTINQLKAKEQELDKSVKELSPYKEYLEVLPDDVFEIVESVLTGGDYRELMKKKISVLFDYSKPFEKQDVKHLLGVYAKGKFSDQEIEDYLADKEEDKDERITGMLDVVKEKFNLDVEKDKLTRTNAAKVVASQTETLKKSATELVDYYKTVPEYAKTAKDFTEFVEGGYASVAKLFFNEDGTWKKDAAKLYNEIKYGEEARNILIKKMVNSAVSKANEDLVARGKDKPTQTVKTDLGGDKLTPEDIKAAEKYLKDAGIRITHEELMKAAKELKKT